MMLSGIESELRGIIETLKSGPVEDARGPTVKLIGFVLRTSNPMYREEKHSRGSLEGATGSRPPGSLRAVAEDLRKVCHTMRCGTPADALPIAERALALFLEPKALART
jgi:hypothetical protein